MAEGKLTVTLVYSYDTNTDYYSLETRGSAPKMAKADFVTDPTIVMQADDWVIKSATWESSE